MGQAGGGSGMIGGVTPSQTTVSPISEGVCGFLFGFTLWDGVEFEHGQSGTASIGGMTTTQS